MKHERGLCILLILVALAGLFSACSKGNSQGNLAGTDWALVSMNGQRLIEQTHITLYFEDTFLGGIMTCNGYGGTPDTGRYIATDKEALTLPGLLAVTVQLCSSPEGVMEQEAMYIETLWKVTSYRVEDERLTLLDANGEAILVYTKAQKASLEDILADPSAYEDKLVLVQGYGAVMVEIALCPGYTGLDQRTSFQGKNEARIVAEVKGGPDLYAGDALRAFEGYVRIFSGEVGCPGELKTETIPYFEITGVIK